MGSQLIYLWGQQDSRGREMENQCKKVENTNNLLTNGGFAPSCSSSLKYIFKRIWL